MQENKDNQDIIDLDSGNVPDVSRLTPKHFDYLESVLFQMHKHQYRHLKEVKNYHLIGWSIVVIGLFSNEYFVINSLKTSKVLSYSFLSALLVLLICSCLAIFSKCFTGIYSFKAILLRGLQATSVLFIFDLLAPHLMIIDSLVPNFDSILSILKYILILSIIYYLGFTFVPFKWLQKASWGYLTLTITITLIMFFNDSSRHFLLRDNEVYQYSNYGEGRAKNLAVIDDMVDKITEK